MFGGFIGIYGFEIYFNVDNKATYILFVIYLKTSIARLGVDTMYIIKKLKCENIVDVMFSKECINNLEIFLKMFLFNIHFKQLNS